MPNKKKSGPWRPPKVFIPKPKTKKSGPGRPKKEIKEYMITPPKGVRGFISTNILHAPRKDNIILLLFVLSLLVFLFSLYVVILKGQQTVEKQLIRNTNPVVNVASGNIPFTEDKVTQATGVEETVKAPINTSTVIPTFYDAFNQKDVKTLYALTDKRLNTTNMFITYFTTNRLTRFLGGVVGGVKVSNIQMKVLPANSTNVQAITYTISYQLKNNQTYSEDRSATLIEKNGAYKIGKLMCETTGCSQMPFFNPGKYWIR